MRNRPCGRRGCRYGWAPDVGVLYLLRHGNAGMAGPGLGDQDRPLNPAGMRAGLGIGRFIAELAMPLDLVLCSTAERTRQTWAQVASCLDHPPEAEFEPALYLCAAAALHQRIRSLPVGADRVMVIGHNPGLHEIALFYCGSGQDVVLHQLHRDFPPAALAIFDFKMPWSDLSGQTGYLQQFVTPKS